MAAWFMAVAMACLAVLPARAETARRPLVVELFTSQGCSSCPPADRLVAGLARSRPDLLALTFHVTYWNRLGWQDPFSFAGATDRQRRYVSLAVSPDVYTPAMVVDGRYDAVGSDQAAVAAALAQAAAQQQTVVALALAREGGHLTIDLSANLSANLGAGTGRGTVLLAGYDRERETRVGRGENGGRTLVEANVVRSFAPVGLWSGAATRLQAAMPAGEAVAVIVQADDGRVLGAARLPPSPGDG